MRAALVLATLLAAGAAGACRASPPTPPDDLAPGSQLEEGPRAEVVFEGNASWSDERLGEVVAEDLEDLARRATPKAAVDDAAYSLELFYRREGFPGCRVDYRVEELSAQRLRATLVVREGPRVAIGEVRFRDNESLDESELEEFLKPRARGLLASSRVWYVESQVEVGLDAMVAYYQGQGFLDVELVFRPPHAGEPDPDWSEVVDLEVEVREGVRYALRSVELQGGVAEVDAGFESEGFLGRPLSPGTPRALRGQLVELYGRAGYPDVEVDVRRSLDADGAAHVVAGIAPGERVTVAAIRVEGRRRTSEGRVLATLALEPGQRYDVAAERKSFRNLYGLGVFSSVDLDLEGEGPQRTLVVKLQEVPGRELYVEPGYGSYERFRVGVGWRERNLLGTARYLDVEGRLSQLAQRAVVGLTDPRFLDTDTSANVSVFTERREEPSFVSTKVGSALTFSRKLTRELELSTAYQFRFSQLTTSDILDPDVQEALEDVNISSLSLTPAWDTRDRAFLPSEGAAARLTLEYAEEALGSQLDFVRAQWSLSRFEPLLKGTVLGLSWRGGLIAPFGSTDTIPIQERYFNGGENTVRSFREDQLGPVDADGNPIGGEAYNVLTIELRQNLVGRLEGALFYDTGNLIEDAGNVFELRGFRHALGLGLRYALPVGPLRLDWGWNPSPAEGESDSVLHFSVGFSF